jgi:hypothetical protein
MRSSVSWRWSVRSLYPARTNLSGFLVCQAQCSLPYSRSGREITLIKDKSVAQQISELMLEYSERINESIRLVQEKCSPEEFKTYRLAAAKVMGEMFLEVMKPLYREHPDLKPEGLD